MFYLTKTGFEDLKACVLQIWEYPGNLFCCGPFYPVIQYISISGPEEKRCACSPASKANAYYIIFVSAYRIRLHDPEERKLDATGKTELKGIFIIDVPSSVDLTHISGF